MGHDMGRRRIHTPTMRTRMTTVMGTLLLLFHFTPWASGFSMGAPDTTCGNLEPAHGVPRQTTRAPYTLTPSAVEIEGGKQMLVTLQAVGETGFKGFLVEARNSDTQEVVGTFFTTDHKYLNCNNGMNNAVTHQGPADKTKVTLTWEAPSDFSGDVVFIGSFVQQRSVFWVGVTSEKVTVKRAVRDAPPPPPAEAAPETTTTTTTTTSTTTTTTPPPSVSPSTEPGHEVNAGDVVISVVDAPSSDVVENDVSVVTPQGDSVPAPTTLPPSPSPSPSTTPIIPTPSEVSTESRDPSEANVGNEKAVEEEEEEALPDEPTSPKPARPTTKRKFGLLGRRRTTTTTTTTTTSTTTASPREPSQGLSQEAAKLERDLINIYDDCGTEKGCFGFPSECEVTKTCSMLVTYAKVSSGFKFEIMGSTTAGYVAAGLSDDEKMGSDSVMACTVIGSQADVVMGFNNGKSNELLVDSKYGLSEIQAAVVDGKTYCTFIRDDSTEISGIVFDLDADRFHLMLATGPASANGLSYHDKRTVSSGTVALNSFEAVEARSELFRTLHASFMVGAWICAASCGIMVARYYKKTWLRHRSCGIDQWFHLHRFFMGLTWSLTVAGFALIVYYLDGWTTIDPQENPHAILGIVSICLCFIQPFMALCRCAPTDKNRPIFNWLHWFVGNLAQILGITAIFFGFELIGTPKWVVFILIIFIAFHCLIHLILSIGQCMSESKSESSNNVYPMKELNGSRSPLQPSDKITDAPGATFRKVMLFFYFLGNFIITAALLLLITVDIDTLKEWGIIFWED